MNHLTYKINYTLILIMYCVFSISLTSNATTLQSGYLTFSENEDGTLTVTGYDKSKNTEYLHRLNIESTYLIDGKTYTVSRIGDYVFQGNTFYSVYIADGIDIGNYSFADISINNYNSSIERDTTLYIGASYIGKHAFENATINSGVSIPNANYLDDFCFKNVYFSNEVGTTLYQAHIGESAFEGSNMTGVFFQIDATVIEKNAFKNTDLSYFFISSTTKVIEEGAFPNNEHMVIEIAYSIHDLTVYDFDFTALTNACFYIRDKSPLANYLYDNYLTYCLWDLDKTIYGRLRPGTIVSDVSCTYQITGDYTSKLLDVSSYADKLSLNDKSGYTHHNYHYTITAIEENAFKNAPFLNEIELGNSITIIAKNSFSSCKNLSYVKLSTALTTIEENAFPNSKKLRIVIPSTITNIDNFHISNLTNVTFVIDKNSPLANTLSKMHLTYQLGENGKTVYARPKIGTTITYKKLKYKVTGKSTVTFMKPTNKNTTKIVIPSSVSYKGYTFKVTKVDTKACYKLKKLKTVTIGDNVTLVGDSAFANCSKLKTITFGKNVKTLGKKVLYNDKKLNIIKFKGTKLQSIGKQTFRNVPKKVNIIVPTSKVKKYSRLIKKAK